MTAPKITPHDVERAERLLRKINGGTDGHAATVLPTTRVLVAFREEYRAQLLDQFDSLARRWCETYGIDLLEERHATIVSYRPEHAQACAVLTSVFLLISKLSDGGGTDG